MSSLDWVNILGWQNAEIDDLRFVGFSYIKQGKWNLALSFFEALQVLTPNQFYDLHTLGALYLQVGNYFMGLSYTEKALKLNPDHEPTLVNRMKILFALGFRRQGLLQAQSLLNSPNPAIAGQAQALLISYS